MPDPISEQILALEEHVKSVKLPQDLQDKVLDRLKRIGRMGGTPAAFDEVDRTADYADWIVNLPWEVHSEDILDLEHARRVLDRNHYGLAQLKGRVLEFISVLKLNQQAERSARAPVLCFVGLVGTGKTTIASSIAEALGKKFVRIPFGGMGDPLDLRGQSKMHPEAEPGQIIKSLRKIGVRNPVILIDEIDRVSEEGRSSIMGVLLELLDPEQNQAFADHYIDYPFDLSEVLFIATANNTTNISTAVLDRLEVLPMPSYTDEEKIIIGKEYMLPRIIKESGLEMGAVSLSDDVWPMIVRPLGYDAGMRSLERTIEGIVRKIALGVVEGKLQKVSLTPENIKEYLTTY
ncbi:MAG: AAA family ATPase [bacterium]|nr:AAA family ATPase [bacterium]